MSATKNTWDNDIDWFRSKTSWRTRTNYTYTNLKHVIRLLTTATDLSIRRYTPVEKARKPKSQGTSDGLPRHLSYWKREPHRTGINREYLNYWHGSVLTMHAGNYFSIWCHMVRRSITSERCVYFLLVGGVILAILGRLEWSNWAMEAYAKVSHLKTTLLRGESTNVFETAGTPCVTATIEKIRHCQVE